MRPFVRAVALVSTFSLVTGCAASIRPPQLLARGELAVVADRGLSLRAEGIVIAHSPRFIGLPEYVACVEPASTHAREARRAGRLGRVMSIMGATFGAAAFVGLAALGDRDHAF